MADFTMKLRPHPSDIQCFSTDGSNVRILKAVFSARMDPMSRAQLSDVIHAGRFVPCSVLGSFGRGSTQSAIMFSWLTSQENIS